MALFLRELLLNLGDDRDEFLAAHPHPVLLLAPFGWEAWSEAGDGDLQTMAWRKGPDGVTESEEIPTTKNLGRKAIEELRDGAEQPLAAATPSVLDQMLVDAVHPSTRVQWLVPPAAPSGGLDVITLGRGKNNEIHIPNRSISKLHAVFLREGTKWMIEDYNSSNGTFLNGARLRQNTIYELTDGDSISFGMVIKGRFLMPTSLWLLATKMRKVGGAIDQLALRRSLEEQLLQSQRMETIGRFAGSVAHDFNNLLTIVHGRLELLFDSLSSNDPRFRHILEIREAAERATSLTRQLLTFSRKQRIKPRLVSLSSIITDSESLLRGLLGESVDLTLKLEDKGYVRADRYQLEQVVMNLVVNARDAMPGGGKLTIETRQIELSEAFTRRQFDMRPGRVVVLSVTDTGEGIPHEVLPHVFEPFFTTKEVGKGSGLGLATVYGIVKQSDGQVNVYSEEGQGTTFRVYLPLVDTDHTPVEPTQTVSPPEKRATSGTETILVVEDEDGVRELVTGVLRANGYTVLSAERPSVALNECQGKSIDLLMTDIVMPEMNGPELAGKILAIHPTIKTLYVSGYTKDAMVHQNVLGPNAVFLEKPFLPSALLRVVRDLLDGREEL